ncbi:MAG: ABC transporter permease subunit [Acidobacteriota bacterium]
MTTKGAEAMATTLAISVVAILLAGLGGAVLGLGGARTLATPEAYLPRLRKPPRRLRLAWRGLVWLSRGAMIVLRAIPAYLWAFLLLALLGPTAWPAILALAFHNAGILGKLSSEVVENLDPRTPSALRALGASRAQVTMTALFPAAFPRMLLFFFYRWETCVRQATILGLLGIVSLGYWIQDARARNHYDEMLFYVLLGSVLVLAGDVVSLAVREWLRRST